MKTVVFIMKYFRRWIFALKANLVTAAFLVVVGFFTNCLAGEQLETYFVPEIVVGENTSTDSSGSVENIYLQVKIKKPLFQSKISVTYLPDGSPVEIKSNENGDENEFTFTLNREDRIIRCCWEKGKPDEENVKFEIENRQSKNKSVKTYTHGEADVTGEVVWIICTGEKVNIVNTNRCFTDNQMLSVVPQSDLEYGLTFAYLIGAPINVLHALIDESTSKNMLHRFLMLIHTLRTITMPNTMSAGFFIKRYKEFLKERLDSIGSACSMHNSEEIRQDFPCESILVSQYKYQLPDCAFMSIGGLFKAECPIVLPPVYAAAVTALAECKSKSPSAKMTLEGYNKFIDLLSEDDMSVISGFCEELRQADVRKTSFVKITDELMEHLPENKRNDNISGAVLSVKSDSMSSHSDLAVEENTKLPAYRQVICRECLEYKTILLPFVGCLNLTSDEAATGGNSKASNEKVQHQIRVDLSRVCCLCSCLTYTESMIKHMIQHHSDVESYVKENNFSTIQLNSINYIKILSSKIPQTFGVEILGNSQKALNSWGFWKCSSCAEIYINEFARELHKKQKHPEEISVGGSPFTPGPEFEVYEISVCDEKYKVRKDRKLYASSPTAVSLSSSRFTGERRVNVVKPMPTKRSDSVVNEASPESGTLISGAGDSAPKVEPEFKPGDSDIPWKKKWQEVYYISDESLASIEIPEARIPNPFEAIDIGQEKAFDPKLSDSLPNCFAGKYMVVDRCGSGGEAVTLKVREVKDNKNIKVIKKQPVTSIQDADWELRQIRLMQDGIFRHEYMVRVDGQYVCDGEYVQLMEYLPKTLEQYIDEMGCLSQQEAWWVVRCALSVLIHLHAKGVIYRDLKIQNIGIAADGTIKLFDYGTAKQVTHHFGMTDSVAFTPEVMALMLTKGTGIGHEFDEGVIRSGFKMDIFSIAVLACKLHTERLPFKQDEEYETEGERFEAVRKEWVAFGEKDILDEEKLKTYLSKHYKECNTLQREDDGDALECQINFVTQLFNLALSNDDVTKDSLKKMIDMPYVTNPPPPESEDDEEG